MQTRGAAGVRCVQAHPFAWEYRMPTRLARPLTLVLLALGATALAEPPPQAVTLARGAQVVLPVPGLQRVAVGDPEVCDVKPLGDGELLLVGQHEGKTTLLVWAGGERRAYLITVTADAKSAAALTPGQPAPETLEVARGAYRVLAVPGLTRVAIGDPGVADVKVDGQDSLLVLGAHEGQTTLLVWTKSARKVYAVVVTPMPKSAAVAPGAEAVTVAVGAQRVLSVPGLLRVALGDPEVCDVKAIGQGELLLVGQKPGATTLLAWTKAARKQFALTVTPMAQTAGEATPGVASSEVHLAVGEQKTLTFAGLSRVAVGDPSVVDVELGRNDRLALKALAPGVTTLLTWTTSGRNSPTTIVVTGAPAEPKDVTPAPSEALALAVGQTVTRTFPGVTRVAIGDPAIADVSPLPSGELSFKGTAAGHTTVLVWLAEGKRLTLDVTVSAP